MENILKYIDFFKLSCIKPKNLNCIRYFFSTPHRPGTAIPQRCRHINNKPRTAGVERRKHHPLKPTPYPRRFIFATKAVYLHSSRRALPYVFELLYQYDRASQYKTIVHYRRVCKQNIWIFACRLARSARFHYGSDGVRGKFFYSFEYLYKWLYQIFGACKPKSSLNFCPGNK